MPDALNALLQLADADGSRLIHRTFNITGFSASAGEIADAVKRRVPGFVCDFVPDFRQIIAESWPRSIEDRDAREEWGWKPSYELEAMSDDMIARLKEKAGTDSRLRPVRRLILAQAQEPARSRLPVTRLIPSENPQPAVSR